MLHSIFQREGEKEEKKEKVPTKKAIEKAAAKAADKKAAQDATTKAATQVDEADEKPADKSTETVVGPEPEVKEVAAGSVVGSEPAPEESLPQIAEPKEADVLKLAIEHYMYRLTIDYVAVYVAVKGERYGKEA